NRAINLPIAAKARPLAYYAAIVASRTLTQSMQARPLGDPMKRITSSAALVASVLSTSAVMAQGYTPAPVTPVQPTPQPQPQPPPPQQPGYTQPPPAGGQPAPGYGQPQQGSYGQPQQGYG